MNNRAAGVTDDARQAESAPRVGGAYAYYVLGVLTLVYVFNFLDRQILAILVPDIRADLGVDNAQVGFLIGTAFAVFYALFGIPLGRLADMWLRGRLMAMGLALWSAMTAASGLATNFAQLAVARFGVGIGEATASPAAFSMLGDYFPRERRGAVLAIYSSGIYIGSGLAYFGGAWLAESWNAAFPIRAEAPFGLAGWQAAFLGAGIPGLLLAILVATLKEPVRGMSEGITAKVEPRPFAKFFHELSSVIPPLTLFHLHHIGGGRRVLARNVAAAIVTIMAVWLVILLAGDARQWIAIGVAVYAVFSWAQALKIRDHPTYHLIFGTPAFVLCVIGFGFISFTGYGGGAWIAAYGEVELGEPKARLGTILGIAVAFGGWLGITFGGFFSDWWRRRDPRGRVFVAMTAVIVPAPIFIWMMLTENMVVFYSTLFVHNVLSTMYIGAAASTLQDLVLPRMRGAATAAYFLGTTIIGLGLGPFYVGKISDLTESYQIGLLSLLAVAPIILIALWLGARRIGEAEATRVERAVAAGEAA